MKVSKHMLIFTFICLMGLYSCQIQEPVDDILVQQSSLTRDMNPQSRISDNKLLVSGNNTFAVDLLKEFSKSGENIFFSPHSITLALTMAYAGAKNDTADQIARTLRFELNDDDLFREMNALDLKLTSLGQNTPENEFSLNICNAIWGQQKFGFLQSYLDTLALNFGADLKSVDFAGNPEGSRVQINDWVFEQTKGTIEEFLLPGSVQENTRLILTNTIYFKADWLHKFLPSETYDGTFYNRDGSESIVPFMPQSISVSYLESPGEYRAVKLMYKGEQTSMIIILPGNIDTFTDSLDILLLNHILNNLEGDFIYLRLAKIKFVFERSLNDHLKSLGMEDAFSNLHADFSGINGKKDLVISEVKHKAFISIDEEGTEASAATGTSFGYGNMPHMTVDSPFVFLIREETTGTILFMGRVTTL